MSDQIKDLTKPPESDLSERDLAKIKEFAAEGMPGLAKLGETGFHRMTEMYLNGSSYWQIAKAMSVSRALVIYLSHTYGWYPAKREYIQELQETIKARVIDAKLASIDFGLLLRQAYQQRIGDHLRQYLATGDPAHLNQINLKEIDKLAKFIATVQDLDSDGKSSKGGKTPAVGLNLGDGVTIERSGDNKVTITPAKDKIVGDLLQKYADARREKENSKSHDISKKQTKNEESEDEN